MFEAITYSTWQEKHTPPTLFAQTQNCEAKRLWQRSTTLILLEIPLLKHGIILLVACRAGIFSFNLLPLLVPHKWAARKKKQNTNTQTNNRNPLQNKIIQLVKCSEYFKCLLHTDLQIISTSSQRQIHFWTAINLYCKCKTRIKLMKCLNAT